MSLTASMWTSVSGLLNHGEKMNVVGNNIANVNTVGFKGSRMDFMDYVHQTVFAAAGPSQVGRGVAIGAIYGDFSQGAFESSTESTDIAINGNGFFQVVPKYSDQKYYTRAGNFRFDADGYLVDPHGYVLQGWQVQVPNSSFATTTLSTSSGSAHKSAIIGTGAPKDIRLSTFSCEPRHTQSLTWAIQLDQNMGPEKSISSYGNPFFSMFENWDATPNASGQIVNPLGPDGFAYTQTMIVYDEGGGSHELTIYFDKVDTERAGTPPTPLVANAEPGKNVWEFIVTMDPTDDIRIFGAQFDSNGDYIPGTGVEVPPDRKGLLLAGTMTFTSAGQIVDIMGYVPTAGGGISPAYTPETFDPTDDTATGNWTAAGVDFGVPATYQGISVTNSAGVVNPFDLVDPVTWPAGFNPWNSTTWTLVDPAADFGDPNTWPGTLNFWDSTTFVKQVKNTGTGTGFYDMNNWVAAPLSSEGYPMFSPNFSGLPGYSEIWQYNDGINTAALPTPALDGIGNNRVIGRTIEFNLGIRLTDKRWNYPTGATSAAMSVVGSNMQLLPGVGKDYERTEPACTAYSSTNGTDFYEHWNKQDGYTYGELSTIYVTENGVLTGRYTNGVTLELFQITLYDFVSKHNLHREGGNLFTQTRESGDPTRGAANSGGFGSTNGNAIEQSNVDLAREFVQMIQTQRGFQSNSKMITTTDTMLENVINMKR